ncbi:aromatase/cyclase [Streptomyces sp. NRRL S-87]|uniref:aromatase/cyclase n=1 Tax=Streptomyces sp. NRRL S-87 TaxID=1463920 RepID=UPI0004BEEFB1|nr:aromatase/cyclase [Streptomyces sp. NRRL S-87]
MSDARVHRTVHEVIAEAPAGVLYGLIADATRWPLFFPPCVHVEQLDFDGTRERLRMWATAGDTVKSWISSRRLDVQRLRVEFTMDVPAAPARTMGGVWTVEPLGDRSRVTLEHSFTVDGDDPASVAWIEDVTAANSSSQLDRLAEIARSWTRLDDLVWSFEDTIRVNAPAELIFEFLYQAEDWPAELPHVTRLDLVEDEPGVQLVSMGSMSIDGGAHSTESVRICFPAAQRIVYKQTRTSPLLAAHAGEWAIEPDETGVNLTARHHVLLDQDSIERVLGEGTDAVAAGHHLRDALGQAGLSVLRYATQYALGAVRVL